MVAEVLEATFFHSSTHILFPSSANIRSLREPQGTQIIGG